MPRYANQNKITDALIVITVLKQIPRHWITASQIQQNLSALGMELTPRRLQRILESMRGCEELQIEVDKTNRPYGYRRSVPDSDLVIDNLPPTQSLLIRLFEEHMHYQLPAPITGSLRYLFDKASLSLKEQGATDKMNRWLKKVAFVSGCVPMMPPKILERIFNAVSEALYRDVMLHVKFENSRGEQNEADVSPLGLVQQEQRLYLVCQFAGYDNYRHLALHRISEARVLDFPAVRPRDFSLDKYISERHFNYSNGRRVRLILEFTSPETARNLSETPFNTTQKLQKLPDGAWRLEADMDDTVLLDGWIAGWREKAGIRKVEKILIAEKA